MCGELLRRLKVFSREQARKGGDAEASDPLLGPGASVRYVSLLHVFPDLNRVDTSWCFTYTYPVVLMDFGQW